MEKDISENGRKTGTTTVGLVCKDGVVLASDRRATMGYLIASKDIDKIYEIGDGIAMTIAGSVGDAQKLVRWMKAEVQLYRLRHGKKPSVDAVSNLLSNILSQYKFYPFFVQLLLGGVDDSGYSVYSIDMLGGTTKEKVTATGSGSPIAYGVLEEYYKDDLLLDNGTRIAAKAISAAMKRDAATGESVDVVVLTKKGFRRLSKEEVKKLISS